MLLTSLKSRAASPQFFFVFQPRWSKFRPFRKQKTHENSWVLSLSGGERDCLRFAQTSIEFHQKIKCWASPLSFFMLSLWDYFMIPFGGNLVSKAMPLRGIGFFCFEYSLEPSVQTRTKQKKPAHCAGFWNCGERGIRTPGPVTVNGFQDRRIRPLCHLSDAKVKLQNWFMK